MAQIITTENRDATYAKHHLDIEGYKVSWPDPDVQVQRYIVRHYGFVIADVPTLHGARRIATNRVVESVRLNENEGTRSEEA